MQPSEEGRLPWQRVRAPRLDLLPEEVQVLAVGSLGDLASPDVGQRACRKSPSNVPKSRKISVKFP